jgi:hypothetical protein
MSYKYVPSGVFLLCDKGAGMGTLTATNNSGVLVNEEPMATDADLVPMLNVSSCGVCSVLKGPCVPQPIQWQDVKVDTVVGPAEWHPLLDCSTLQCAISGKIRILFTRADAEAAQAAQAIHEVAHVAKEASLWTLAAGALCAVAGVACCLTGVGVAAAPFLFAASAELFEVSAVTFEAGIALDVAALAVEPNLPNLGLVVVDALTLGAGKLIGKVVGKAINSFAATELGERVVAKVFPYTGFGGDIVNFEGRTTTVLGKFRDPITPGTGTQVIVEKDLAGNYIHEFTSGGQNPGGINILDIPTPEYNKLIDDLGEVDGNEMFWNTYNKPFLDDAFASGHDVRLLSDPANPLSRTSTYARELDNIQGYTDKDGNWVTGLAEQHGYTYNPATTTYEPPVPTAPSPFPTSPTVVVQPPGPDDQPGH